MKKYLEERVQDFLDSEVLQGDEEKVLYLKLFNKLKMWYSYMYVILRLPNEVRYAEI